MPTSWWPLLVTGAALLIAWWLYPRPDHESAEGPVDEIVLWMPVGAATDVVRVGVEAYVRRHPGVRVRMGAANVRNATADPTRFLLGVAGDEPPDLIYFDRFAVVEWASRGAFEDLNPYLRADEDRPDGVHESDYYPPAWNEARYQGRQYAVPNTVDTRALYYHTNALIRAGLVGDDGDARPPESWEELCRKRIHAEARAEADGTVRLEKDRTPADLDAAGVRTGDVVVLVAGTKVFRGRIGRILDARTLQIDLSREQPPDRTTLPDDFDGAHCNLKVFDQDSYVARLTRYDEHTGALKTAAFLPLFGNSWLYMFGWMNGGRFMSEDGTRCTLDSDPIAGALQFMTDLYDAQGGVRVTSAFEAAVALGGMDPFLAGRVAMRIDGDGYLRAINTFIPDLAFGVAPAPIPQHRRDAGHEPTGWMGGWSFAIPATAHNKDGAWRLLRWLCSVEANEVMARFEATLARAQGRRHVAPLHPNRHVMQWLEQTYVTGNPTISQDTREGYAVFVRLLSTSWFRPVTPVGQKLWMVHDRATDLAIRHLETPQAALRDGARQTQTALDRFLHPPTGPTVSWGWIIALYVVALVVILAALVLRQRRRLGGNWIAGYLCASPWLIGFIVFGGGPIVFSLVMSFCHYDVLNPARFVGLSNYLHLFGGHVDPVTGARLPNDPLLLVSLGNTAFMIVGVPLGIVAGLALAMLLNTRVRGQTIFRTIYYLPAIMPAVAGFVLWIWMFDPVSGPLNQALRLLGVSDPPHWLQDPAWAKPALILMGLWGAGGSMIIWLAGLKEIPESLYEAACIDGAGRVGQFRHVTLPLLTPYIFFNLIMGLIGVFQTFESAYVMTSGGPADATLFYAYKLFNEAFRFLNLGVASAMAWVLFLAVLLVTLSQIWLSRKWVHYER
ncbi:MAG: hypothetical protein CMJ18_03970 [Phycisphaeraceae bacterium]|nr:hypothetical protein [Phycisphaeraceae bacterium]